jgi:hypothetical protein
MPLKRPKVELKGYGVESQPPIPSLLGPLLLLLPVLRPLQLLLLWLLIPLRLESFSLAYKLKWVL